MTRCQRCDTTWTGLRIEHCPVCHGKGMTQNARGHWTTGQAFPTELLGGHR